MSKSIESQVHFTLIYKLISWSSRGICVTYFDNNISHTLSLGKTNNFNKPDGSHLTALVVELEK